MTPGLLLHSNPFPGEQHFIHLDKYCIQNYLLDYRIAGAVSNKSELELRTIVSNVVRDKRHEILKKNKFFEFLFDQLTADHLTQDRLALLDASVILDSFVKALNMNFTDYIDAYIRRCQQEDLVDSVFPDSLIKHMNAARRAGL